MAVKKTKKPAKKSAPARKKTAKVKAARKPVKVVQPKTKVSRVKPSAKLPSKPAKLKETKLGEVEDFFSRISVIALTLKAPLSVGDTIRVLGHTTMLTQKVESMQIEHATVQKAKKGDGVGVKVNDKCRKGDEVFLAKP